MGMTKYVAGYTSDDIVLNHPLMTIQRNHKQLGQIDAERIDANHSRYNHLAYALYIGNAVCDVLQNKERLNCARADIIQYIKIHDIGHPPYSHAVEYVLKAFTGQDHKQRSLALLDSDKKDSNKRTLRKVLQISGANIEGLKKLITGDDKAASICNDKSIGVDKLAYTFKDAEICKFDQMPPDWEFLAPHLTLLDSYGIDINKTQDQIEDQIDILCAMQYFYFRMYTQVYLSTKSLTYERHIQKAVELAIRSGIIDPNEIWEIGDDALIHSINNGITKRNMNPLIAQAKDILRGYTDRKPYHSALAFKFKKGKLDIIDGQVLEVIDTKFKDNFLKTFENPLKLTELEDAIKKEMHVDILCSVLPDPEKVKPSDVPLYLENEKVSTLKIEAEDHYKRLNEMADKHFSIRVLVPSSELEFVRRKHKDLSDCFKEQAQKIIDNDQKRGLEKSLETKSKANSIIRLHK